MDVDSILRLIMQQGDIEANRIREEAAWQAEIKRAKNAWKGNTLKALATIGTMFIPGIGPLGGIWTAAGRAGMGIGKVAAGLGAAGLSNLGQSLGGQPRGIGFTGFNGPVTRSDFSSQGNNGIGDPYNPFDDEPI